MKYLAFVTLLLGTACLVLLSGLSFPTMTALTILILAFASDSTTTWLCLKARGREGNPVIAFLFRKVGVPATFGIVAVIWTCFIVFRWLPQTEGVQTAVALAYWLIPMNNLIVLARLKKKSYA